MQNTGFSDPDYFAKARKGLIMKKFVSIFLIAAALALVFAGCSDKKPAPTSAATTAPTTAAAEESSGELNAYLKSFVKGDSPIYGTWQIEGVDYLSFIFRNDELAEMVMDNEGDFTKLRLDEKNKTLGVSFALGLNGVYSYELSDNNSTLNLTLDDTKITLKKQKDYSIAPKAPKKAQVDPDLLGWWKSEEKQIYYFGGDGVMYSNNISMETAYTYSAASGKINAVYNYGGEVKKDFKYNIKSGKLIMDNQTFKKFNPKIK